MGTSSTARSRSCVAWPRSCTSSAPVSKGSTAWRWVRPRCSTSWWCSARLRRSRANRWPRTPRSPRTSSSAWSPPTRTSTIGWRRPRSRRSSSSAMGNYVTVAGRPHPHWGTDPCPGDPEAVEVLAGRLQDYGERAGLVSAFFEGAGDDLAAAGSWHGESQLAFDQVMKRFPMNLRPVSDALDGVAAALRGWAGELRELQSDTLYLDWRL